MKKQLLLPVLLLLCCFIASGCSFSNSSKHSFKSSSSPSRSSSGGAEESASKTVSSLQEDIEALTILYVGSSGSSVNFQRELGQISAGHGVVDWESHPGVFTAIGEGVKRAGVAKESVAALPFLQGMTSSPLYPRIVAAYK